VACTVDAQCPSGQTCQANVCTAPGASCTSDDACASGQACFVSQNSTHTAFTAACQPGNAGKALGGEACAANTDCFSGRCFIYAAAPTDGICVDACDPATGGSNCGFSATCPSTGVVFYLPGPNGMYDPTTPSDDVWASTNVCWPMTCTTDSDCLFLAANSSDRACSPQPTSATAPNDYAKTALYCMPSFGVGRGGDTCTTDTDCASGACLTWTTSSNTKKNGCFGACLTNSDCLSGSGQCVASLYKVNGTFVNSCTP
jgi:Cys-rich repeat protein